MSYSRLSLFLLFVLLFDCDSFIYGDFNIPATDAPPVRPELTDNQKQELWDDIKILADIYYESWDTYREDDALYNTPVGHGDGVGSWKPKGPNVIPNSDLVWTESKSGQPDIPTGYQWWSPESSGIVRSVYFDNGNWDRYVNIPNGFPQRWQSYPGWTDLSDTHDFIYIFRPMPGNLFETLFNNVKIFDRGRLAYYIPESSYPNTGRSSGNTPVYSDLFAGEYVFSEENQAPILGEDAIMRVQRDYNSGQIRIWINDQKAIDFVATPGIDFKNEFTIGTNSHPFSHHLRALLIKNNGAFTKEEYDKILKNSNLIWTRNVKPEFPYLTNVFSFNGGLHFKPEASVWDIEPILKNATFSGGNGVSGNHTIQWYYWNPSLGSNVFRRHLPIDGATDFTLSRNQYNEEGQPFYNHEGDGYNIIFYVITPHDEEGNAGEPLRSAFVTDEFL
ncbi:MAG: hypothetical protein ACON5F_03910 [Jejuia sp.]